MRHALLCILVLLLCFTLADKVIRVDPSKDDAMNPGDVVTTFHLLTLSGNFSYVPLYDNSQPAMVFFALDPRSGFGTAMWETSLYLKNLFLRSPDDTVYIFLSYAENSNEVASHLQSLFQQAMDELNLSTEKQGGLFEYFGDTW